MALLFSFSLGLAAVLIGLGLLAVFASPLAGRFRSLSETIPIMSAIVLIVLGIALAI
jgi:cytochrome c biogenesis protein CcdA